MRAIAVLIILACGLSQKVYAEVPYASIDQLRKMTVVTRVASDFPKSPKLQACDLKEHVFANLGANLSLQTENSKAQWSKIQLVASDLDQLKAKVKICESRGSCPAYLDFLVSAKGSEVRVQDEIKILIDSLNLKLSKMKSQSYLQAWDLLTNPCGILKSLLK